MAVRIEGLDDCLRILDQADANLLKMSRTALQAGNRAVVKQLKGGLPSRWAYLTKSKVMKLPNGKLAARMGIYRGKHSGGAGQHSSEVDDWFKAYWANYGTLEHRDPNHQFDRAVKHGTDRRRNNTGQQAQNFFERAGEGWQDRFVQAFRDSIKKQEDKIYGK